MARILIAYATGDGQTGRVATRMADVLKKEGHQATLADIASSPQPRIEDHDAVLLGAPVRFGRHRKNVIGFCREHVAALQQRPSAFFSVSLSGGTATPGARREVAKSMAHFLTKTTWVPARTFVAAGALLYTKYNPFLRRVMRLFARMAGRDTDITRDYEYTDWSAVEEFARDFGARLPGSALASAA